MNIIQQLEKEQVEKLSAGRTIPDFQPGDTVLVNVKVVEGSRSRVQVFQGDTQHAHPVAGSRVGGLRLVHLLLFGQVLGAVREAPEFGIDLGQREKRTLLFYFGFHALTFM